MDLVKIGKYIAEKRKGLGLTQKQVAEKLGMSDKSVSKWERGICLPDVSIYMELCNILGISINEFLAGEDISEENIIKKSEDNLIQVTKDSKHKQKNLKKIIAILIIVTIVTAITLGTMALNQSKQPSSCQFEPQPQPLNYIEPLDQDSVEMKTVSLLSGVDTPIMIRFITEDQYETFTLYMSVYHFGELISKERVAYRSYQGFKSTSEGMIVFMLDAEQSMTIQLIVADKYAKSKQIIPVMENIENAEYFGRASLYLEKKTNIKHNSEHGLAAFVFGKDGIHLEPIVEMEKLEIGPENDYVYYFSYEFGK